LKVDAFSRFACKLTNALLDIRFGGLLRGLKATRYAHLGAYDTANSDYGTIRALFRGRICTSDVLVDVGCGKGRVINAWLLAGYSNQIIGVELDPDVAAQTRARLQRFPNVSIITGDIITTFPDNGTVFYLYNPFTFDIMCKFKARLKQSLRDRYNTEATVVYYNCRHAEAFAQDEDCDIHCGRLNDPYLIVRVKAPSGVAASR
jgi:SAM-dependent methyltransferase